MALRVQTRLARSSSGVTTLRRYCTWGRVARVTVCSLRLALLCALLKSVWVHGLLTVLPEDPDAAADAVAAVPAPPASAAASTGSTMNLLLDASIALTLLGCVTCPRGSWNGRRVP